MNYSSLKSVACVYLLSCLLTQVAVAQAPANRFSNGPASGNASPAEAPLFSNAPAQQETDSAAAVSSNAAADANPNSAVDDLNAPEVAAGGGRTMLSVLRGAGLMAFPIAGCSILLVMFTLERAINLRRRRVIPKHFVKLFLSELEGGKLKPVEALQQCEENRSPISEVFAAAVKKWNRPSVEVEQAVIDAGEREANGLRRYLRLFNGIATVSPLLGLLGTVLGMIRAFNVIASSDAMGKPEKLAAGISEALLTTAGGLSVAIPAFIVYMYFTGRVDRLIIEIDSLGQRAVSAIASDAWKGAATKSKKAA